MSLSTIGSQDEPNGQVCRTTTVKRTTNVYEYGLSHPTTVPGNSSRILPATKNSTYLFLVGIDRLMNVPLTILIPDDQYPHPV